MLDRLEDNTSFLAHSALAVPLNPLSQPTRQPTNEPAPSQPSNSECPARHSCISAVCEARPTRAGAPQGERKRELEGRLRAARESIAALQKKYLVGQRR